MRKDIRVLSRKLHRKKKRLKIILSLFACAAFLAGVFFFFHASFFKIKEIAIKGNDSISVEVLRDKVAERLNGSYYGIFPRDNIFFIPKEEIKKDILSGIPRVKNIRLDRKIFFRNLAVEITERQNGGILCRREVCSFVDEDGFVFEKAPYFSGGVYLRFFDERVASSSSIAKGENILPSGEFKKLIDFDEIISKVGMDISKIILKKEEIYELYTAEGWRVLADSQNTQNDLFRNLTVALDEIKDERLKLDYIDLRFGNRVFYKFKE